MRSVILAALIGMTPIAFGTITKIDFDDENSEVHGATYHGGGFWTCWLSWYYYDEESNA